MNKRMIIASAFAAAIATPALIVAQKAGDKPKWEAEKCYGISKAGQNDCAATGSSSCAGTSKVDSDPQAWLYMPTGYCNRIVGGSLEPKQ